MNHTLESFALKLVTQEGLPMAVGGICLPGTCKYWSERFLQLALINISMGDIYNIDYVLAQKIQEIADKSLLIAGCSLNTGKKLMKWESTGGVIGCPQKPIRSAPDACEMLPDGFSLYTSAGGPGLAAVADPFTTERTAKNIKSLGIAVSDRTIINCMKTAGISTYLLVLDGTGSNAQGCVAVATTPGKSKVILL